MPPRSRPKSEDQFPASISPMLCTIMRTPADDPDFIHEIKFDGYRIIAFKEKAQLRLDSRSGLDYTARYPAVVSALKRIKKDCILDGEVCVLNKEGKPDFDALQKPPAGAEIVYYVFDLLWINGRNLMHLPLVERKKMLLTLVENNPVIRYSEHFEDGVALFRSMQEMEMEGIVSKERNSRYVPGERGKSWLKTPTEMRQEFVIGGWVESERRRPFASLLFGAYKGKKLEWVGHAGGGFKEKEMADILKKLKAIEVKKSPFVTPVEASGVTHWVKPVLVANFKFSTFTRSGRIRKPAIFLGFRDDKKSGDVVREIPAEPRRTKRVVSDSNWKLIDATKTRLREIISLGDCEVEVTDYERELWSGVSKMELISYYHNIAPWILPHIKDRPQSLHLKPLNAGAPGFYIKDMEGREPECATVFTVPRKHKKQGKREIIDYLVCNNEATLLYMVNLGCVDVNPWTSRTVSPDNPDYIIIDLDPSDNDFSKAVNAAIAARQYFVKKKLVSFVKTSGKTGIHIYLPCSRFDFAQARAIAEKICLAIHEDVKSFTTVNVDIASRGDRLYLDPNQNDYADTVAAPYCVRPGHRPLVSTPLDWKEVRKGLTADEFTIETIAARLKKKGDLFAGVLDASNARKNDPILARL